MEALTLPGTLDALKAIRDYVFAAADASGLDKKRAYRLGLAVDEIATNIVIHGYTEAGLEGSITVEAQIRDADLTIILQDNAIPYNPLLQGAPAGLDARLEDREMGGLGVFLAFRNVDKFDYEYVNGCNRNIFVVNRGTPAQ
jgi:serine/threonine-protein kinase RsbW